MTIIIGVVIIILLVISLIPNYQAMKLAKIKVRNLHDTQLW